MKIRVRVTSAAIEPSDTSGFVVEAEVADAEAFIDDILRRPDDEDCAWPLGKRYGEIVDEARRLRAHVAELEALAEIGRRVVGSVPTVRRDDGNLLVSAYVAIPSNEWYGAVEAAKRALAAREVGE